MSAPEVFPNPIVDNVDSMDEPAFVQYWARFSDTSEADLRQFYLTHYGSVQCAMDLVSQVIKPQRKLLAAGPREQPVIGSKPMPEETVRYVKVKEGLWLRIWGDRLEGVIAFFAFDFVDRNKDHQRRPPELTLQCMTSGKVIFSMEDALRANMEESVDIRRTYHIMTGGREFDSQSPSETFLVPEGTRMGIVQPGAAVIYVNIPRRGGQPLSETMDD